MHLILIRSIGIKSFYKNDLINTFDWTDAIIWDNDSEIPMMKIPRALDPMLLPILQKDKMQIKVEDGVELVDRYNISNDHHYQTATGQKERIRQQYGPIRIQHSLPAIKLVYPFVSFTLPSFLDIIYNQVQIPIDYS